MFSKRQRTEEERKRLAETLAREYGWSDLRLADMDRGFYGETWRAEAGEERFFVKLVAYRRHIPPFLQSLTAVCRMNALGLDFISRPIATQAGEWFVPVLDGVAAVFRYEEGLHTEEFPVERLLRRLLAVYRLPTQELELPWEQFGRQDYDGFLEALEIVRRSELPAARSALRVLENHRTELEQWRDALFRVIPLCRSLPVRRVITSGDVGGNVLLRGDQMIIIDWDELKLAPVERDLWWYMRDMRQIELFNRVFEEEALLIRIQPEILAYYAFSRTFFYLRDYLFSSLEEDGARTEEQMRAFLSPAEAVAQAMRMMKGFRYEGMHDEGE